MIDVLNSVLIKHDSNFKSLTKIALSQILLKIIYESKSKGINSNSLKANLESYLGISFNMADMESALNHLKLEKKINPKANRYFISESYKEVIDKSVNESEDLHKNVIDYWFSQSETYKDGSKKDNIFKWFNKLIISFFKEYRYDWINDLKNKKTYGKRKSFNIDKILSSCFENVEIVEDDKEWLKDHFVKFVESSRLEDNELLWSYGSSMFSATLLTALNYADDFSVDIFKDSTFVLDTNILMTIGLEGHELNYAFQPIENVFQSLNIHPIYFYITKEEYRRAISRKRQGTFNVLDTFGYEVLKETECGIIATAIKRLCKTKADFETFFEELENAPNKIFSTVDIKLEDYLELHNAIEVGCFDEDTQERINAISTSRTGHNKSKNVLEHDAGLIQGALYIKKKGKAWILTKDSVIREYANSNTIRDEYPIAIGLDSFIQMMAIKNGNIENSSANFAPLFAKIVQFSLLPEKNMFKVEDLEFILDTKIEIQKLRNIDIIEVAKEVNKLRINNKPDDDIALEVRRYFQSKKSDYESERVQIETRNFELEEKEKRDSKVRQKLRDELFDNKYSKRRDGVKKEININRWKLIGIPLLILIILFFAFVFNKLKIFPLTVCILLNIVSALLLGFKFKIKLFYTKDDDLRVREETNKEIDAIMKS